VWIFFEQPYPAGKSRRVFIHLLEKAGVFSVFDKSSSFDRLFPNQDKLSGKGLGNLIALPLHKTSWENGNSCFIDPDTLVALDDQWGFLANIKRVGVAALNSIYAGLETSAGRTPAGALHTTPGEVSIILDHEVRIGRAGIPGLLIDFLKTEFNFANSEFIIKKNAGRNTWGTERFFRAIRETDDEVVVPRGSIGKLIRFCREQQVAYVLQDARKKLESVRFVCDIQLRAHQVSALEAASRKDFGVIVAPPGAGKTVIGLKIIAEKQQPALIIVHRKQLMDQWMERIQAFLGIPKHEIGVIGSGKYKGGKKVTVAMIQSLAKALGNPENIALERAFGTILVDECHHIPAETFRDTIERLHTVYLYGLTATPFRKYNDGRLIFIHLGEIISELKVQDAGARQAAKIVVRETELDVPFNAKTDRFETLSKVIVHDSSRNRLILGDVKNELDRGRRAVIITERKEHIEALYQYLKQSYEAITLSGEDPESARAAKWKALREGNFQVLITTGQFFGEGTDLGNVTCLFLVYPFSFEGKLIQYVGRVQRGEVAPTIYDYHDRKVEYLHRLFLKRNAWYRKIVRQATLFDEPVADEPVQVEAGLIALDERVRIPIEALDFRYGCIGFVHQAPRVGVELQVELENDYSRPEFDVLKPYFSKVLGSKYVEVRIVTEVLNGEVIALEAESDDLKRIDREVIESVKFRFVERQIIGQAPRRSDEGPELLDAQGVQAGGGGGESPLYESGEALLEDIMKHKTVRHYQQLRYLAERHERAVLKLRFVLSPFSFVFLLAGETQYHIVLETLDTEEATYLWHVAKDRQVLREALIRIERDLHVIRNEGRQYFLETRPVDFSRVMHDYSDVRKGFVVWRDLVEERLV
jgi:superfamily II DNA or RNA helicase